MEYVAVLEKLKGGAAGAQARVTDNLARSRTAGEAERGVPPAKRCQGLAAELGLARRTSPHRGAQSLGLARALVREMPRTHELLTRGEISEWRATLVVRETAVLSVEDRQQVDAELGDSLARLGDREAAAKARAIGYRLDPGSAIRRTRGARSDRHVSLRPAPDTMCYLTALLPVEQGAACAATLRHAADTARSDGEARSRGQVMADTLVERITGRASAGDIDVEVQLVMTDSTLLTDDHTPAHVVGYGPIHAALAREMSVRLRVRGCAVSTAVPRPAPWSRWTAAGATSSVSCASSSSSATRSAVRRGATPPSATPTTPSAWPTAARPPPRTAKGCARPATTPRRPPAGGRCRSPASGTKCCSPPPPGTPTSPPPPIPRSRASPRPTTTSATSCTSTPRSAPPRQSCSACWREGIGRRRGQMWDDDPPTMTR
ncbi:MAG: DUF222 domain-containing protein, partial [Marmoricola sp.]|nr:DUF222 domain-containing protein [Marmoricola sp.]